MKRWILFGSWACLYAICAALGFINEPATLQSAAMLILSLVFFVPGFWLAIDGLRQQNKTLLRIVRGISIGSLVMTTGLLVAVNLTAPTATETVSNLLQALLILFSVPMLPSGIWALSLFLWACLLFTTSYRKKD